MVETHKRKRKNTVITKITLTSNAEHVKQTSVLINLIISSICQRFLADAATEIQEDGHMDSVIVY